MPHKLERASIQKLTLSLEKPIFFFTNHFFLSFITSLAIESMKKK